ncbi:hypothetical protein Bbelb_301750 [Branchiostoma belcheri]|nr:hypothetical protein Bbelb_301750 [Branchiostoma belcheri]
MALSRVMLLVAVCLYCVHHHQTVSMEMSKRFLLPYGFGYYCDCKSLESLTNKFCRYDCPWLHRRQPKPLAAKRDLEPAKEAEELPVGVPQPAPECECHGDDEYSWRNPVCRLLCRTV